MSDVSLGRRGYAISFRGLRNQEGQLIGECQFVSDVTDRLREQQLLRETETGLAQARMMEALGQLAGGIRHEINNLLWPSLATLV